jgi:hypothetical protein
VPSPDRLEIERLYRAIADREPANRKKRRHLRVQARGQQQIMFRYALEV